MSFLKKLADYIDGAKSYLVSALSAGLWIASRLHLIHLDEDLTLAAGLLISGLSGLARAFTWKPGGLTDAVVLHQPDGGAIVVKPPPVQP